MAASTDQQPRVATIHGFCRNLHAAEIAPGPCQIDLAYGIGNPDDRILPRRAREAEDD